MLKRILTLAFISIVFVATVDCTKREKQEMEKAKEPTPKVETKEEVTPVTPKKVGQEVEPLIFKGCSIIRRAFMSEVAAAYEKAGEKKINVMGGGATLGVRSVAAGDADIGGACRPCLPDMFNEEKGVYMTQIAWGALVFITHPSNPVNNVTLEQGKDILLGKITNWKQVGGPDKPIRAVIRSQVPEHGGKLSGSGYMFRLMVFNNPNIEYTENALFFKHSAELEETIEKIEYTFAITGVSSARKRKVKILNLNGVQPTKANIGSGKYPLFRPLYLITKGEPSGEVKKFIDWLLSKEGQRIVSEQGTVNLIEGKSLKKGFKYWVHTELITNY